MIRLQVPRRMPRFRLMTLLVFVTVVAVVLGLVVRELHREHRKTQVAKKVRHLGGYVHLEKLRPGDSNERGIVNGWLRLVLGDGYFSVATNAALTPRSNEDLNLLLAFPEIKRLQLGGPEVTDAALERLRVFPQLEGFSLSDATISERGLELLKSLPKLNSLAFRECPSPYESLKSLTPFANLQHLRFDHCPLSDSDLECLHGAQSSVELVLINTNVTETGILAIHEANPTWSIRFRGPSTVRLAQTSALYENYLPSIQQLPRIPELVYSSQLTSDATLAALKDARSLTRLRLAQCRVTDDGMRELRSLTNLSSLALSEVPITGDGIRELRGLTELRSLSLIGTKVEDRGLELLPPCVRSLDLGSAESETAVQSLASVSKRISLEFLCLSGASVTDDLLPLLDEMTSLRRLMLWNTAITDVGVARLKLALPDCEIKKLN